MRAGARPLHNTIDDHNQRIQLLCHFGQPQFSICLPGLYADNEPHARLDELRDCVHSLVQPGFGALDSRFPFFVPFFELGFETFIAKETDPCEVYLHDYKDAGGGLMLPHRLEVRFGDKRYGFITINKYTLK